MTPFAHAMEVLFILGWCVGVAAWFYSARFFFPRWANGFRKIEGHEGYRRKALTGAAVFAAAVAFCFAVGGLAQLDGGWS